MNQKGNIIVYAVSVIGVMAITASFLTVGSLLEVRKATQVERSSLARYKAEAGIENSLFLLNRSLEAGKSVHQIKEIFGFDNSLSNFAERLECYPGGSDTVDGLPDPDAGCASQADTLNIQFGAEEISVNFIQNEAFTLNIYDPENKNSPPYDSFDKFKINKLALAWTGAVSPEFEITFIAWENNLGVITPINPVKRVISDASGSFDVGLEQLIGGAVLPASSNNVAVTPVPCVSLGYEEDICTMGDVSPAMLGKIRIRLLNPARLDSVKVRLYFFDGSDNLRVCAPPADPSQCVPTFVEITSVGKDGFNKQALKVIGTLPDSEGQTSSIWDYVLFSDKSLTK